MVPYTLAKELQLQADNILVFEMLSLESILVQQTHRSEDNPRTKLMVVASCIPDQKAAPTS